MRTSTSVPAGTSISGNIAAISISYLFLSSILSDAFALAHGFVSAGNAFASLYDMPRFRSTLADSDAGGVCAGVATVKTTAPTITRASTMSSVLFISAVSQLAQSCAIVLTLSSSHDTLLF